MAQHPLTHATSAPDRTLLFQPDVAPCFIVDAAAGFDWVCPTCDEVLIRGAVEGQFWDVAIRCPSCQGIGCVPELPAGRATGRGIGGSKAVRLRLANPVEVPAHVVCIGPRAYEQRMRETGRGIFVRVNGVSTELNAAFCEDLLARAEALLGESFQRVSASHTRSGRSRTPSRNPHRLLQLMEDVQATKSALSSDSPSVRAPSVLELNATVRVMEAWSAHPVWPMMRRSMQDPGKWRHDVILLLVGAFLADCGNDVTLVREGEQQTPDLWLAIGPQKGVGFEVKVPDPLVGPRPPLSESQARRAIRKAIAGSLGQLTEAAPGFLAIGGFHLRMADVDLLEAAARAAFTGVSHRRLVGIAVVNIGGSMDTQVAGKIGLNATFEARLARNPVTETAYPVSNEERPWMSKLEGQFTEVELPHPPAD